jgi:hypothetical protein
MRRGGGASDTPAYTGYAHEGLQGILVNAVVLHRAGYPAFEWGDQAIKRAFEYLDRIKWPVKGDDAWQPWIVNHFYPGYTVTGGNTTAQGKNMAWAAWVFGGKA